MILSCFATCPRGIEDLLVTEVQQCGAENCRNTVAGVSFDADIETIYRICLWSRIANRVLLKLHEAPATNTDELYQAALGVPWELHLNAETTFAVHANLRKTTINHSHFAALRIKDAIADYFTSRSGKRPSISLEQPDVQVTAFIERDQATFYLDLSGDSLHQRGYRLRGSSAPLKENLAAALLLRSGWPTLADDGHAFVDFMCGSGTLPIEAALIASDTAPALNRQYFGFIGWQGHNPAVWERLQSEAQYRSEKGREKLPAILGFDRNRRALEAARENAERAGVSSLIQFAYQDLFEFNHDFPREGLLLSNPPYGQRLGSTDDLERLYRQMGEVMKSHFNGWRGAIFAADPDLVRQTGLRSKKSHSLSNGNIDCRLFHFEIDPANYFRDSRLPGLMAPERLTPQAEMLANRLQKNQRNLRRWLKRDNIHCYRLYDADLPEYAFAVDVYQDETAKLNFHVQEYEAPADIDAQKIKHRVREILTVLARDFDIPESQLYLKTRRRQRGDQQYEQQDQRGEFLIVPEGGCRFRVNLQDYLDTGLFLDHRPLRNRIQQEAQGKRFLNLFCYTASATVHAAKGGAISSSSVDMSNTYTAWAKENFVLNGMDAGHQLIQADCTTWLQETNGEYDLILLDPPAFSNSKKMKDAFDVQRHHAGLIKDAMALLAPSGTLYFSTNFRRFKLDQSLSEEYQVNDIHAQTIPQDFNRRQKIHFCWQLSHLS